MHKFHCTSEVMSGCCSNRLAGSKVVGLSGLNCALHISAERKSDSCLATSLKKVHFGRQLGFVLDSFSAQQGDEARFDVNIFSCYVQTLVQTVLESLKLWTIL